MEHTKKRCQNCGRFEVLMSAYLCESCETSRGECITAGVDFYE